VTVIVSIPSQQYTPRTLNLSPAIPAGTKRLVVTLTREAWPEGPVGSINVNFPDGTYAGGVTMDGGEHAPNRFTGAPSTTSGVKIIGNSLNGVAQDLPAGNYAVSVVLLQTITTSVLAERF
jgi:hypothetical protein